MYDGTDFHGWQVQPGLPTIQGILEDVIGAIEGGPVQVPSSGRTDAGVHAVGQVAAVTLNNPIPPHNFRRAVNRLLPYTIRITNVVEVPLEFHPRFASRRKVYEYRIFRDEICPPFDRRYVHHHPYPLDEAAMMAAAPLLEGEHDFTSFAASEDSDALNASKVRHIYRSVFTRTDQRLIYTVAGSGFLKHMVRNIVGVLLEVGKRNLTRDDVLARLDCPSFPAGPTAAANGLFLISVDYSE